MGLDMYLSAKQYLFSFNEEDKAKAEEIKKLMGTDLPIKEVAMQAMYWRKANAIHDWFVSMVQEGEVTIEELGKSFDSCTNAQLFAEKYVKQKSEDGEEDEDAAKLAAATNTLNFWTGQIASHLPFSNFQISGAEMLAQEP